tara:strand:- start:78 stop:203 length:126 start_codon:yes stop_codon:yes gene_type:complete
MVNEETVGPELSIIAKYAKDLPEMIESLLFVDGKEDGFGSH